MTAVAAPDMVRADKAAEKLGVSSRTVKRAIARGEIPGTRLGRCYLLPAAWLAEVTSWPRESAT